MLPGVADRHCSLHDPAILYGVIAEFLSSILFIEIAKQPRIFRGRKPEGEKDRFGKIKGQEFRRSVEDS